MDCNFTHQDIDVLMEAVDAWISKDTAGMLMDGMLGAMFAKTDEARAEFEREQKEKNRTRDEERKARKERAVVLQAKLISLRDSAVADEFVKGAQTAAT